MTRMKPTDRARGRMYLDTSAVRSLGRGLSTIPQDRIFTSALTIVELVSAAASDDQEFARVRPALAITCVSANLWH